MPCMIDSQTRIMFTSYTKFSPYLGDQKLQKEDIDLNLTKFVYLLQEKLMWVRLILIHRIRLKEPKQYDGFASSKIFCRIAFLVLSVVHIFQRGNTNQLTPIGKSNTFCCVISMQIKWYFMRKKGSINSTHKSEICAQVER